MSNPIGETKQRKEYALIYARLHQTIERMYWARESAPWLARMPDPARELRDAERRAWIRAHGSPSLQELQAVASIQAADFNIGRDRGAPYASTQTQLETEWLAKTFPAHLKGPGGPERAEAGYLYERRVPGDIVAEHYVLVRGAAGSVEPRRLCTDLRLMHYCVEAVEYPRDRALALLGLDATSKHAQFLTENRVTGQQAIKQIDLYRDIAISRPDIRSASERSNTEQLLALAVAPRVAAQIREHRALAAQLEAHYERPVTPVREAQASGRVDRLFKTPEGQTRAVVVADRALHLVNISGVHERDARRLLNQQVSLTRGDKGLSIAVASQRVRGLKLADPGFELGR